MYHQDWVATNSGKPTKAYTGQGTTYIFTSTQPIDHRETAEVSRVVQDDRLMDPASRIVLFQSHTKEQQRPRKTKCACCDTIEELTYRRDVEEEHLRTRLNVGKGLRIGILGPAEQDDLSLGDVSSMVIHGLRVAPGGDESRRLSTCMRVFTGDKDGSERVAG